MEEGGGGVFRRWRGGRVWALSPSLILDVVYSSPLSSPRRELIASVHISIFYQWLSCCRIISSDCDSGSAVPSLFTWKTAKRLSVFRHSNTNMLVYPNRDIHFDFFLIPRQRDWVYVRHVDTCYNKLTNLTFG